MFPSQPRTIIGAAGPNSKSIARPHLRGRRASEFRPNRSRTSFLNPDVCSAVLATLAVCRRCCSRHGGLAQRATRQVPPRPPKEEPTPFPREPIFPPAAFRLLELYHDEPDLQELIDALEDFQELHERDRHWGQFPNHVADCRNIAYNKGQLRIVQGILSNIEQEESEDLRMVALDTLLSLMIGGCLGLWCRFLPWHCASFLCPSQPLGS
ncbi:unnamed protein product [Durusdinium trenchii]|uniref:Uncharacterized protein n=1 Tax=Durusdinium trenchii TaxID=1381693 RepID=A0ABP0HC34_9DINO